MAYKFEQFLLSNSVNMLMHKKVLKPHNPNPFL